MLHPKPLRNSHLPEINPHSASPAAWQYYKCYRHFASCVYNSHLSASCRRLRLWGREAEKFSRMFAAPERQL